MSSGLRLGPGRPVVTHSNVYSRMTLRSIAKARRRHRAQQLAYSHDQQVGILVANEMAAQMNYPSPPMIPVNQGFGQTHNRGRGQGMSEEMALQALVRAAQRDDANRAARERAAQVEEKARAIRAAADKVAHDASVKEQAARSRAKEAAREAATAMATAKSARQVSARAQSMARAMVGRNAQQSNQAPSQPGTEIPQNTSATYGQAADNGNTSDLITPTQT
ncbi:hypothetical protein HDE_05910 [Halotydeus destructor]|nr:hypothetical protein HDE_05910 [Halotydeus destructor]